MLSVTVPGRSLKLCLYVLNPADKVEPVSLALITFQSSLASNLSLFCLSSATALSLAPLFQAVSSACLCAISSAVKGTT